MILNASCNLFRLLIINRNNSEMSTEGSEGKVTHCPCFLSLRLLVSLTFSLFMSLSVHLSLAIDLTLIVFLFHGPPLYHTQHLHIHTHTHTGLARLNVIIIFSPLYSISEASKWFSLLSSLYREPVRCCSLITVSSYVAKKA